MRKHYDLSSGGRPNPYFKRISAQGREVLIQQFLGERHLFRLADDVAEAFPDEASVNQALRLVLQLRQLELRQLTPTPASPQPKPKPKPTRAPPTRSAKPAARGTKRAA